MELRTSVVIATRGRWDLLRHVVEAVRRDPATDEIVVVDDADADDANASDTQRWLRSRDRDGPPLHVVAGCGVGPARARQLGVVEARGDRVVLLDDDVVPRRGLIGGHVAALGAERGRVTVGYSPIALPARRGPGDVARYAYARDYERRCERYERGRVPVLYNLWGGNVGVWREAALRVGLSSAPFDARQVFYEDRDFGLRAHRAGLRGVFDRSLRADHHHRRSARVALEDAVRRGACTVRLHRLHGDLIGPFDLQALLAGLPRPVAAGVRTARRPGAERAALAATLAAIEAAGRHGQWTVQDVGFKLARRLREQRGALLAAAGGGVGASASLAASSGPSA